MTTLYQNPNEDAGNSFTSAPSEEKKKDNGNGGNGLIMIYLVKI